MSAFGILDIPYNYSPRAKMLETSFAALVNYLSVGVNRTCLPEWTWSLNAEQSKTLLNGMLLASDSRLYSTSSRRLADDVQRLALHAGGSADMSPPTANADCWSVCIHRVENRPAAVRETMHDYDGKVHCLEVPGHVFYVRRHGIPVWTGNSRSSGPLVMLTRQPAEGRARDGGLRFGEMERDCMVAHGTSEFLKEIMMEKSDNFQAFVCKSCGLIGQVNPKANIFKCASCPDITDFCQIRVPYAYKLFLQELESMSICSRLLPESRLRRIAKDNAYVPPTTMTKGL